MKMHAKPETYADKVLTTLLMLYSNSSRNLALFDNLEHVNNASAVPKFQLLPL